jgi:hypothetical protein
MDMSLVQDMSQLCNFRYTKQRNYVANHIIVIKYIPIALAVLVVNIILRVKPVEHEIVRLESPASSPESLTTSTFLFTINGICVEPKKMSTILATTYTEFGLAINLHDLRHALEAFSHKLSQGGETGWNPFYAWMANHGPGTSGHYGRDQNSFVGIPANVSEANMVACNYWNSFILHSPSSTVAETQILLMRQLQELKLLDEDIVNGMDLVQTKTIRQAVRIIQPPYSNLTNLGKICSNRIIVHNISHNSWICHKLTTTNHNDQQKWWKRAWYHYKRCQACKT